MTGTSTPTRSCLKRRLHVPNGSLTSTSELGTNSGSSSGSSSSRHSLCKTVSFDGEEHVYFADPDYDRHSVPVAPKLSYEDILELKMLNINLMCPQNNKSCSIVPIGILPLLPASDSNTTGSMSPSASATYNRPKPSTTTTSPLSKHLSAQNQRFVGLLDDDLASMASSTPPPSSPSTCDHSPVINPAGGAQLPIIATDEEGQLIFRFSASDDLMMDSSPLGNNKNKLADDHFSKRHNKKSSDVSMEVSSPSPLSLKKTNGPRQCDAMSDKQANHEDLAPPFPIPPTQSSSHQFHNAALTLTPSFFSLAAPQPATPFKPANSSSTLTSSSPFPFAPPVPTTAGLPGIPTLPALPQKRDTSSSAKTTPTPSALVSPTSPTANKPQSQHQRSTSSSSSTSPTSPQATPHASPTYTVPLHSHMMKSQRSPTPTNQTAGNSRPNNIPGPLSALQRLQPKSPQLAGLPSPSLVPPSPLSLYPPGVDHHSALTSVASANPGGFFGARKASSTPAASHMKKSSIGNGATSAAVGTPSSPVIKPVKS